MHGYNARVRTIAVVAWAAITFGSLGCGRGTLIEPHPGQHAGTVVLDRGDVEKFRGTIVIVEGEFDQIRGEHGIVKLDSGLKVYLPNVSLTLRGEPWFDFVRKRVQVQGLLRTDGSGVPGMLGPSIEMIDYFRVLE